VVSERAEASGGAPPQGLLNYIFAVKGFAALFTQNSEGTLFDCFVIISLYFEKKRGQISS